MALRRLRNLIHWRRETAFRNGEPASEPHVPINPLPTGPTGAEVSEQSYRNYFSNAGLRRSFDFAREIFRNNQGNPVEVAQMPEGSVAIARNESDRSIHTGELLVVNENGGVRPIEPEELESMMREGNQTIVASLEEVPEGNSHIRVRVQQGLLNIITGEPYRSVGEAISRIGEVMQPIVNEIAEITQPLAEMIDEVVNELAEGCGIPRETLLQGTRLDPNLKYDKKYPHICFECKQPLQYKHALGKAKEQGYTEEQHKKMWKSAVVEYYCCNCYEKKLRNDRLNMIVTPHPTAGIFAMEHIRRSMADASFRWGPGHPWQILPRNAVENIEMIPTGYRRLRLVGEGGEILYEDTPPEIPEPFIVLDASQEPPEVHRINYLDINVRIVGQRSRTTNIPFYCNHSARRIVNIPLPENLREINFAQDFPEITDNVKLTAIAQLYTKWLMLIPEIRIGHLDRPDIMAGYLDRILRNPQFTPNYYNDVVRTFGNVYEDYLVHEMTATIADYRERILWQGYNIEPRNSINHVHVYGGIVDGERLEAHARQTGQINTHTFVDNHPEITSQEALNDLALSILNRQNPGFQQEYHQNPISIGFADCHHQEFNERGECLACGITRVQIDMMRSTRLAEHHRMEAHTFENINGEMLCSVCRLSTMEIDRRRNTHYNIGEIIP